MSQKEAEPTLRRLRKSKPLISDAEWLTVQKCAYAIFQTPGRVPNFMRKLGMDPQKQDTVDKFNSELIDSLIDDPPGYGINLMPDFRIGWKRDIRDFRPEVLAGFTWTKEGKPFPADVVLTHSFTVTDLPMFSYLPTRIYIRLVADGASLMLSEKKWSNRIPEDIKRAATVTSKNKRYYLPDVMWAHAVYKMFGLSVSHLPFTEELEARFSGIESVNSLDETIVYTLLSQDRQKHDRNRPNLAVTTVEWVNRQIGTMLATFPEFDQEETFPFYPSGVIGAVVSIALDRDYISVEQIERIIDKIDTKNIVPPLANSIEWASTGDVSVTAGLKLLNHPQIVDEHDMLLDKLVGRDDFASVITAAKQRRYDVGNLQGAPVRMETGSYNLYPDQPVIMYTDGKKLLPLNSGSGSDDETARLASADMWLAHLWRRYQNRMHTIAYPNQRHADDGGILYYIQDGLASDIALIDEKFPFNIVR